MLKRLNPRIRTLKADSIVEHKLLNPNPLSLPSPSLRNINEHRIVDGSCSFRESHRRVTATMKKKLLIAARRSLFFRYNKPLSFEVSNSVGSSNVWWRGWSYAASVRSDDTPNAQKDRKRIPKHERRAMVEAFVNKYRAMNDGKFPTVTDVKKQIGGGYYAVRDIIKELEYKSKMNANSVNENLLENEQLDSSKFLITKAVKVSSGNTGTAKDGPIQEDSELVVLDDTEAINSAFENVEEERSHAYLDSRLSKEVEIISTQGNHCIASESNLLEKGSEDPYPSSLQKPNDVKTEEAVSRYSGSVPPESHLPLQEKECVSTACSENYGIVNGNIQGQESESVDLENHKIKVEKCVEKADYNKREQAALEELFQWPSKSSFQVPNDVKTGEDVSSYSSDSTAPERHLPKEVEHGFAPFIVKPGSSHVEAQSSNSEFVYSENYPINKEQSIGKLGYGRKKQDALKDIPGVDGPKHKMEQAQGPSELVESKIDNSNNRETSDVGVSEKSTLWGNLKSLADGIINIWRKL